MSLRNKILLMPAGLAVALTVCNAVVGRRLMGSQLGLIAVVAATVALGGVQAVLVHRLVLGRIAELRTALAGIQESGDPSARVPVEGEDEIAQLGTTLNQVLEKLETAHRDLRVAHDGLLFQTTRDAVTGLSNRTAIMGVLARELVRAGREHSALAVMLVDVDGYKLINQKHGQGAGDAILRGVATRLRMALRPYDHIGRYGADEFLVIVPGCRAREAQRVAARLCESVRMGFAASIVPVTVTIGATVATGQEQAATVVAIADSAMFRAKHLGHDRVEFVGVSLPERQKNGRSGHRVIG
ncbi:MAG: GGDEF domain-containing protein [Terriglobales bacterium]